jgi:UDP-glucose/iron transport system ATP-binding protein
MIIFDNVTIRAGGKRILDGVSFRVRAGEKVVFCGESGSGKSTILLTLLGACVPSEGRVVYHDEPISSETIQRVRRDTAYVPQEPVLGAERVREAIWLPYTYKAHCEAAPSEEDVHKLLTSFRLKADILDQECASLSGGEKQRLAIVRAILLNKTVFVADEVTSALDPESRKMVVDYLLGSPHTVVSVSHDPDWIAGCGRCFDVAAGRVREEACDGGA